MVLAAFRGLSTATRANYRFIQQGVAQGLSAKAINTGLLEQGRKGIRRQDLLEGMRFASGVQTQGRNIANVALSRRPSYERFPTFTPVTSNKKYLIQYEVRWTDPVRGTSGTHYITIGTDERLTRGELDLAASEAWGEGQQQDHYSKDLVVTALVPVGARQQLI